MKTLVLAVAALAGVLAVNNADRPAGDAPQGAAPMRLGNFSVSLAVKDLAASRAFYESLGFRLKGGDEKRWVVLQNDSATIGLFQGMFDKNMLTFNPGWDRDRNSPPEFDDVRDIQKMLEGRGLTVTTKADPASTGPAYITLTDPDGNPVLIDQHVPRPAKK